MIKKVSFKQWMWLITLLVIANVFTLVFYYLNIKGLTAFSASYVTTLFGLIYLLIGWMVPNNYEFKYRKETAKYNEKLPKEIKDKMFLYRFPLISASIITLLLSVLYFYILK